MKRLDRLKCIFKDFIRDNYKGIIFLIIFSCFCFYDTGYSIYKPGGIINLESRITGDNLNESSGSLNMAYVGFMEGKAPIYLIAKLIPSWEIVKNEDITLPSEDMKDSMIRDKLDFKESINNALYLALSKSNTPFEVESDNNYIYYVTSQNESELKIGDIFISYDDIELEDINSLKEYIASKNIGDKIRIKYKRDNNIYETDALVYLENDNKYIGISTISIMNIKTDSNISIKSKDSESGPSGGLMMSLAFYNALTKDDITNGKRIVGTGTINKDGSVGKIGGVNFKLASAVKNKADIFICSNENYDEVLEEVKKNNYKIKIISVGTFDEALISLQG